MHLNKINTPSLLLLLATLLLHKSSCKIEGSSTGGAATAQDTTASSGVANLMEVNFEQALAAKLAEEEKNFSSSESTQGKSSSLVLSRKRRYLVFPEGSSFQVVYDGIFGVVDYVNYLILGITCSLAWPLPSATPSEMIEDIRTQLQEGTFGLPQVPPPAGATSRRNDTINHISYVDVKKSTNGATSLAGKKSQTPHNLLQTQTKQQIVAKPLIGSYNKYYTNKNNLMPAFHVPMHQNYYRPLYSYPYQSGKYSGGGQRNTKPRGSGISIAGGAGGGRHYYYPGEQKNWRRKDDYYYSKKNVNPFRKWTQVKTIGNGYTPAAGSKYPWWNLPTRLSNSLRDKPRPVAIASKKVNIINSNTNRKSTATAAADGVSKNQQQQQQQRTGNYQSHRMARKHRILPIFGKRSIREPPKKFNSTATDGTTATAQSHHENLPHHRQRRSGITGHEVNRQDRIHIRHHRLTRHQLYEQIEKFLDKRGAHGQHCILRTLCETGQKSHEQIPGSFVGELMRTVFTLPESIEEHEKLRHDARSFERQEELNHKQRRYDEAHAYKGHCAQRYQLCKDSLWTSQFVM